MLRRGGVSRFFSLLKGKEREGKKSKQQGREGGKAEGGPKIRVS